MVNDYNSHQRICHKTASPQDIGATLTAEASDSATVRTGIKEAWETARRNWASLGEKMRVQAKDDLNAITRISGEDLKKHDDDITKYTEAAATAVCHCSVVFRLCYILKYIWMQHHCNISITRTLHFCMLTEQVCH